MLIVETVHQRPRPATRPLVWTQMWGHTYGLAQGALS
jgi:hypothetical protein